MAEPTQAHRHQMIQRFSLDMAAALEANTHKGGWSSWTPDFMADKLIMEVVEFLHAAGLELPDLVGLLLAAAQRVNMANVAEGSRDHKTLMRLAANIANYALLSADAASGGAVLDDARRIRG